jgi:hypothetical protein
VTLFEQTSMAWRSVAYHGRGDCWLVARDDARGEYYVQSWRRDIDTTRIADACVIDTRLVSDAGELYEFARKYALRRTT